MVDEVRRFAGDGAVDEFTSFVTWLGELLPAPDARVRRCPVGRCRRSVRASPGDVAAVPSRRFPPARHRDRRAALRRAVATGVRLPVALRRGHAPAGTRDVRHDHLPRHGRRRVGRRGRDPARSPRRWRAVWSDVASSSTTTHRSPAWRRSAGGSVEGLDLGGGERIRADAVVVNADVAGTYRSLLALRHPVRLRFNRYAPSCMVWSAGVRGVPTADVAVHNIHFGEAWDDAFDALESGQPDARPVDARHGRVAVRRHRGAGRCHVAVRPRTGPRTSEVGSTGRRPTNASATSSGRVAAGWGYPDDVVVERTIDPLDWRAMGLARGTPFSLAHTFRQTGPFRPGKHRRPGARPRVRRRRNRARGRGADGRAVGPPRRRSASPTTPRPRERSGGDRAGFRPLVRSGDGRGRPGVSADQPPPGGQLLLGVATARCRSASARPRPVRAVPAGRRRGSTG